MICSLRKIVLLLLSFWLVAPRASLAMGPAPYLELQPGSGGFGVAQNGVVAGIFVGGDDFPGVIRAAGDLQMDIDRVTGITPDLVCGDSPAGTNVINHLGRSAKVR